MNITLLNQREYWEIIGPQGVRDKGAVTFYYFVSFFILYKYLLLSSDPKLFCLYSKALFSKIWSDKLNIYVNYQEVYGYSSIIVAEQACPVFLKIKICT